MYEHDSLSDPWGREGLVTVSAGPRYGRIARVDLSPDEARLYALKLIRAADRADEEAG
jgi:hypothetical protein